jgi:hypothetical protein
MLIVSQDALDRQCSQPKSVTIKFRAKSLVNSHASLCRNGVWFARRRISNGLPQVEVASLYWHLVDAFWLVLFPVLYVAPRG